MLNPVPQLHTPNGTLAITLPFPLLNIFTLVTVYLYQKDERVLQCSKFFVPTVYSKTYSTSHCTPAYYYHHNHHHHHHDQTSLGLRSVLQFLSRCQYGVEWCTIMTGELKETGKNVVVA